MLPKDANRVAQSADLEKQPKALFFFNTWFTIFFLKILRSEEGKKLK